jgi:hypothetical protein
MFGKVIEVRTAASAAVQKRDDVSDDWDTVSWPVPDWIDQTSVVSEILALLMVLKHLQKGLSYVIYADCMAVIIGWGKSWRDLRGRGRHDGLWKQIYEARDGLDVEVLKTKAHRSKAQAIREDDTDNYEGNEAADRAAKRSAGTYGHPPSVCHDAEARQLAKRRGVAWTLATLKQAAIDVPEVPRTTAKVPSGRRKTADWEGTACVLVASKLGGFVCQMCYSKYASRTVRVRQCTGLNAAARKVAAFGHAQGHALSVGRIVGGKFDGCPLFMCGRCGSYASSQCKQLKSECLAEWGGRRNGHTRFTDGKHPCLPRVGIEGHRATMKSDFVVGLASVERHDVFWSHASVGGRCRSGAASSRGVAGALRGGVPPPVVEAPAAVCSPSAADLHGDWDDAFGPEAEAQVWRPGGADLGFGVDGEFSAWEAAAFFGAD